MSYLPPPVGKKFFLAGACNPIHPISTPAFGLPLLPSKMFLCSRLTHMGALVILYRAHAGTNSSPLALSKPNPDRPRTPRCFNNHPPYTHLLAYIRFFFWRASFPLDEIISVRTRPSSLTRRSALFVQTGDTQPSWDTPLSTLRVRQVDFPSSGAAGDSLHATFRA